MQAKDLDTQKAITPWFAARDARMRSIANQSTFSQAQQVAADRMALVMPMVYSNNGIHINYRQRFIAIKIDGAKVKDRKTLKALEQDWDKAGYIKRETAQGVIYRIPKK
jgi:hypothetical protein